MRKPTRFWKQYSNVLYPTSSAKLSTPNQPIRRVAPQTPPSDPKQIFVIIAPPARVFGALGRRS